MGKSMSKTDDGYGALIGLCLVLALVAFIVYCIFLIATAIVTVAAAGGTIYGGGTAIKNYFSSFKENIIDENR